MGAKSRQFLAALTSAITGALGMSALSYLEPLMEQLTSTGSMVQMTPSQISWLVSFIEIGEVISTLPAGLLADKFGRKVTLLIAGMLSILSWLLLFWKGSIAILFLVRLLQGVVLGTAFTVAPMYIAEISEPRIRGELSSHFETMCMAGIMFVYVTGPFLTYEYYIAVLTVLPIIFVILFFRMPESPYYLLMINKEEKASESLKWLRDTKNVDSELQSIQISVLADLKKKAGWKDLFRTNKDRKAFFIVQVVCLSKYLNGRPSIFAYATKIFEQSSNEFLTGHHVTILLGASLCLSAIGASFMSDTIGRRKLLIFSSFLSAILNIVTGIICFLSQSGVDISSFSWLLIVSVIGFSCVTNIGLGSLAGTVQAEFFPSHTRGIGGGVTGIIASIGIFLDLKQFQSVEDWAGIYLNFWIFAVIGLIGSIIIYIYIPETAGKSLSEIQTEVITRNKKNDPDIFVIQNSFNELEQTKL